MSRHVVWAEEAGLLAVCIALVLVSLVFGRAVRGHAPEIAFIRNQNDVYVLDIERGFVRQIAHSERPMNTPRWSPDGKNLTFTVIDGSGQTSIQRIDANGKMQQLFQQAAPVWSTAWSPDSNEVAFIADKQLFLINADGSDLRQLHTFTDVRSYSLSWSPDGKNLAFIGSGILTKPYVYLLSVKGGSTQETAVTNIPADPLARPTWSPDSKQLAFISGSGLYLANADGSEERHVANTTITRTSEWSPDGRLAYVSDLQLHVASPDGEIQPLPTDLKVNRSPTWSPDGDQLAFVSGGDLYLIDAHGGTPHLITPDADSRAITDFVWRD
ncbi:MAG: DPP IV N-terminal domain-containing protein [Chloroflexota bacterium]